MQERLVEPALTAPEAASPHTPARRQRQWAWILPTAAVVLAVDQLTKWWALEALADGPVDLVWTLRLRLVFNTGAAFSLATGLAPLLAVLAAVVVALLLRAGRGVERPTAAMALGAVLGGALGNLADRVLRGEGLLDGAVVDFVDLQWWPVFNVADAAIVAGAAILVLTGFGRDPAAEEPR